jgi:hypothetical protein
MSLARTDATPLAPFRFIIVGAGRCGTGYMSKVFQSAGVECGHETVFGPHGLQAAKALREAHPELEAEASWLAVPYLTLPLLQSASVIHLVRDPWRVLASFVSLPIFRTMTPFSRFIHEHQPHVFGHATAVDKAAAYILCWNRWIEALVGVRRIVHRVEDDPATLLHRLNITPNASPMFSDKNYNHRGEPAEIRLEDIADQRLRREFVEFAQEYGYQAAAEPREPCFTASLSVNS